MMKSMATMYGHILRLPFRTYAAALALAGAVAVAAAYAAPKPVSGAKQLGHGKTYVYPHDEPFGVAEQQYAPDVIEDATYYRPTALGAEAAVKERWERIRRIVRGR